MNERQAAEEFAALLADPAGGRAARTRHGQHAERGEGTLMLALADRLGQAGRALPAHAPAQFRSNLRAELVALTPKVAGPNAEGEAGRSSTAVPAQRGRGGRSGARHGSGETRTRPSFATLSTAWRRRLLAAGVGVAVATGSVGGIAIASAGAEPGDPLYNAKKIFESLQLSLSGSTTDQGRDYLHFADIRLSEIDSLLQRPDVDLAGSPTQAYLRQTLDELRTMIAQGGNMLVAQVRLTGDQTALHALSDFLLTERQRVADLSWRLPPSLQSEPPQIVALMDQLNRQLQQAEAAQAAQSSHIDQGPGSAGSADGGPGGGTGTQGSSSVGAGKSGAPSTRPSGSAGPEPSGSSASGTTSPSSAASIGVDVPLPLPTIGVTVPGLLGLPAIDLGIGDDGASSTP
ncbi:DUF5667 domain-containing protein [Actinospica robiniae]|uniref:DUF5667 domain-containing protein n=1 Tax=Actinospica robiniae TaxID=304901 RepID=UPI00041978D6|nr:DUF5667 domain-containing protein [Actinospica robiniae]